MFVRHSVSSYRRSPDGMSLCNLVGGRRGGEKKKKTGTGLGSKRGKTEVVVEWVQMLTAHKKRKVEIFLLYFSITPSVNFPPQIERISWFPPRPPPP